MRVLLTSQPGYGHFLPLLPLARALVAGGHEVRVGTSASFAPVVERAGFRAEAVGLNWILGDDSTIPPDLREPPAFTIEAVVAHRFVHQTAERLATDIVALADRWRPDLIVRETLEFGGPLAAQILGLPSAALQVASPTLLSDTVAAAVAAALDVVRVRLGLPPDPAGAALRDELVVCFAPPALHDPAVRLPSGLRSFHPGWPPSDGSMPEAIAGLGVDRPLVYATLGTAFNDPEAMQPFFSALQEGLPDVPVDVLLTLGADADPEALGEPHPGVRVVTFVPQRAVLNHCAVVVCHGGYGTVLDAIDAAVPLVIVPFGADQFVNAMAVERVGIGIAIEARPPSARAIRDAVQSMLDPRSTHRSRIEELREQWRALPGPEGAAAAVIGLAMSASAPESSGRVPFRGRHS
jgi:UDP:flavonoid glycosyltransferase YjiC (YdhE family)